jgi:hypothetical protein
MNAGRRAHFELLSDLGNGGGLPIYFYKAVNEVIDLPLARRYWHFDFLSCIYSKDRGKFSSTSENRTNIIEESERRQAIYKS